MARRTLLTLESRFREDEQLGRSPRDCRNAALHVSRADQGTRRLHGWQVRYLGVGRDLL